MTDTISHTKYSYLTHMEWKDPPPKKRKEKKEKKRDFSSSCLGGNIPYRLNFVFCFNAFQHLNSNLYALFYV